MSEISNIFRALRGDRSLAQQSALYGIPDSTIQKLEAMGDALPVVMISTLKDIMERMKISDSLRLQILIAWIKASIGREDFTQLEIKARDVMPTAFPEQTFKDLSSEGQAAILSAIHDPRLLNVLQSAHTLAESIRGSRGTAAANSKAPRRKRLPRSPVGHRRPRRKPAPSAGAQPG